MFRALISTISIAVAAGTALAQAPGQPSAGLSAAAPEQASVDAPERASGEAGRVLVEARAQASARRAAPAAESSGAAADGSSAAADGPAAAADGPAAAADGPAGVKTMSGMSVLGNQEAPTSLVIVPWKSSEMGDGIGVSRALDTTIRPVDKDVFARELRYYQIRASSAD